jgi:hypothetical protein
MYRIILRTLDMKDQRDILSTFCKVMTITVLRYGGECWVLTAKVLQQLQLAKINVRDRG